VPNIGALPCPQHLPATLTQRQCGVSMKEYLVFRLGRNVSRIRRMQNMCGRSLGAPSITFLWRYWNPIAGYILARGVYKPLKKSFPRGVAVFGTFLTSGFIFHDLPLRILFGWQPPLFTFWFSFLGVGLVVRERFPTARSRNSPTSRLIIHAGYFLGSLMLALLACVWIGSISFGL
jgi:hypothetical protein